MKRVAAVCSAVVLSACAVAAIPASVDARAATRCTTSAAQFANPLPKSRFDHPHWYERNVQLSANRGSLWAGVAFESTRQRLYGVITWRPGQKRATLLGSFTNPTGGQDETVVVAGITPSEAVVAAVKKPNSDKHAGYAWYRGKRTTLSHRSSWDSVSPVGVANDGTIYGKVHSNVTNHLYIVSWAHRLAPFRVVRDMGTRDFTLAVVPTGAIAYTGANVNGVQARFPTGQVARLVGPNGQALGGSEVTYGSRYVDEAGDGIYEWDLGMSSSGAISPSRVLKRDTATVSYTAVAAGPRGDLVFAGTKTWVRTPSGGIAALTSRALSAGPISRYGTIAVTLKTDGLVHLVRCG